MTEQTQIRLMTLVEKTVRPMRASLHRKRSVREELWTHVSAVFEEERIRLGDELAATDQAIERFGDPVQVTAELNDTVTRFDSFRQGIEWAASHLVYDPDRSLGSTARSQLLVGTFYFLLVGGLVLVSSMLRGKPVIDSSTAHFFLVIAVTMAFLLGPFCLALTFLWYGLGQALFTDTRQRPMSRILGFGFGSMALFPFLAFATMHLCSFGDWSVTLRHTAYALVVAPFVPFLFLGPAHQWVQERRAHDEWARLDIA